MEQRSKPLVFAINHTPNPGACQAYRISAPLRGLEQLGYADGIDDHGTLGQKWTTQAMLSSDVALFYSLQGEQILHHINVIRDMKGHRNETGGLTCPPVVIYDADDNADYVHPYNFTFSAMGIRNYPDGSFLEPGDSLTTEDAEGVSYDLWIDKETQTSAGTFDIARNRQEMKVRHQVIRGAHGVTVPTPAFATYMRDVIGATNVRVFPNTVFPEDFEQFPLLPHEDVRILWQGSPSHYVDWYPLKDAVREVAQRHPAVKWVIYGEKFRWITDVIPEHQLEYHHWTTYPAYKVKRGNLRIDINLCPLADNAFNRCKSAIKWYEGSLFGEATLAARVTPYKEELTDGETGLLYDSPDHFVTQLDTLIRDTDLRKRLARAARSWVFANRTPEHTIPGLWNFYEECRQIRVREYFLSNGATNGEIKRLAQMQGLTI